MIRVTIVIDGFGPTTTRFDTREQAENKVSALREKYGDSIARVDYYTDAEWAEKLSGRATYHETVASYDD